MRVIQTMVQAVNRVCGPLQRGVPLMYQLTSATTQANLLHIKDYFALPPEERESTPYPDQDVVCLIAFSWGHTDRPVESRAAAQQYIDRTGTRITPGEYHIQVNELAMELQNHNLWLSQTDSDWHRPLVATLRIFSQKNKKWESNLTPSQVKHKSLAQKRDGIYPSRGLTAEEAEKPPWKTIEPSVWRSYDRQWAREWTERYTYSTGSQERGRSGWQDRATQESTPPWSSGASSSSSTTRPRSSDWRPSIGR